MVDRLVGPELAAEVGARLVADDGDDLRAERAPELDGGDATPAGGAEHDQPVACDDAAAVDETDPTGEVRDPEPRRLRVGEPRRDDERTVRPGQALLGERTVTPR